MSNPHTVVFCDTIIEKRASPRQRVLKSGIISFGGAGIDCTVRNTSEGGAQIEVPRTESILASFRLAISADNILRRCRKVWDSGKRIGVSFE